MLFTAGLLLLIALVGCGTNKVSYTDEQKQEIITQMQELVEEEGDIWQVLPLYMQLTEFEEVDSDNRQKALKYIMKVSLDLVNAENIEKVEEGLRFATELEKSFEVGDFYVQNRILTAYKNLAKHEMARGNYDAAYDLIYNKALTIRFDTEVMRTYLNLRKLMAEKAIEEGDYDTAKQYLGEAISISTMDDNVLLYKDEHEYLTELFMTIADK